MTKRKGASIDLPIKFTLLMDGQEAYEWDTQVVFFFLNLNDHMPF